MLYTQVLLQTQVQGHFLFRGQGHSLLYVYQSKSLYNKHTMLCNHGNAIPSCIHAPYLPD